MRLVALGFHESIEIEQMVAAILWRLLPAIESHGNRSETALDLVFGNKTEDKVRVLVSEGYYLSVGMMAVSEEEKGTVTFDPHTPECDVFEGVSSETIVDIIGSKLAQHLIVLLRRQVYFSKARKFQGGWSYRLSW